MADLFRPLRRPVFSRLWGATMLAHLGFWVQDTTLGWLIVGLTASPQQVALVPVAAMLPMFLLALPAGALGDMVDRRRLLLVTQTFLVLALAIFVAALLADAVTIGGVLLFALVSGTLNALSGPSRQSILPQLVPKDEVRAAVTLGAIGFNASRAIGPMVGGVLLAALGAPAALAAYAISCVLVALAIASWREERQPTGELRLGRDLVAGLRYMFGTPTLRNALLLSTAFFVAIAPLWAFLPLVAKGFANGDSGIFSLFMMAVGSGAVIGGFSGHLNGRNGFLPSFRNGALVAAAGLTVTGLATTMVPTLVGLFLAGLGWIGVSAGINTHVLLESETAFRSRAIALTMVAFAGGLALGSTVWGQIARLIGVAGSYEASAAILTALATGAAIVGRRASAATTAS